MSTHANTHTLTYQEFENLEALSTNDRALVLLAQQAAQNAYAPYSHFHVGAALRLDNGAVYTGNNQENASFPAGICAERVAMAYAQAQHPHAKVETLVIVTQGGKECTSPVAPCGVCRQFLLESELRCGAPIRLILHHPGCTLVFDSIASIIPFGFVTF